MANPDIPQATPDCIVRISDRFRPTFDTYRQKHEAENRLKEMFEGKIAELEADYPNDETGFQGSPAFIEAQKFVTEFNQDPRTLTQDRIYFDTFDLGKRFTDFKTSLTNNLLALELTETFRVSTTQNPISGIPPYAFIGIHQDSVEIAQFNPKFLEDLVYLFAPFGQAVQRLVDGTFFVRDSNKEVDLEQDLVYLPQIILSIDQDFNFKQNRKVSSFRKFHDLLTAYKSKEKIS
jgi:hypothetical protein